MAQQLTLDHNSLIDLEQENQHGVHLRTLLALHEQGTVKLRVVAIGAAERQQGGTYASTFQDFQRRIASIGLAGADILPTIAYYGISFDEHCYYADTVPQEFCDLEWKIHEILFPKSGRTIDEFRRAKPHIKSEDELLRKFRSMRFDVLTLWSHIYHGSGILVTRDGNFRKATKMPALVSLGAGTILTPAAARAFFECMAS